MITLYESWAAPDSLIHHRVQAISVPLVSVGLGESTIFIPGVVSSQSAEFPDVQGLPNNHMQTINLKWFNIVVLLSNYY